MSILTLDGMDGVTATPVRRSRGQPPQHLLSSLAIRGGCSAGLRIGTQNSCRGSGIGSTMSPSPRYRVYECAGTPGTGSRGYHVSMRQEYLEQVVVDEILARVKDDSFQVSRARRNEDPDGRERKGATARRQGLPGLVGRCPEGRQEKKVA